MLVVAMYCELQFGVFRTRSKSPDSYQRCETPCSRSFFCQHGTSPPTANFAGPTLAQRGSCRLHVGPNWAQRVLLSGFASDRWANLAASSDVVLSNPSTTYELPSTSRLHVCSYAWRVIRVLQQLSGVTRPWACTLTMVKTVGWAIRGKYSHRSIIKYHTES